MIYRRPQIVAKDSNVNIVVVAAKCIAGIANGIRKEFSKYALMVISLCVLIFVCNSFCDCCCPPIIDGGAVDGALQGEEAERGRGAARGPGRALSVDEPRGDPGDGVHVAGAQDARGAPASGALSRPLLRHEHAEHAAQEGAQALLARSGQESERGRPVGARVVGRGARRHLQDARREDLHAANRRHRANQDRQNQRVRRQVRPAQHARRAACRCARRQGACARRCTGRIAGTPLCYFKMHFDTFVI